MNPTPATIATPGYLAGIWKADPVHSKIGFSVRQLMVRKVGGQFTSHDVTIVTREGALGSSVAATIDLASIDTGNERRDNHLRSAGFFEVETYPTMNYRSTGIRQTDDGWVIDGELTLHGVTRQVPLAVEATGSARTRTAATGPASPRPRISTAATSASIDGPTAALSSATRCRSASRSRPSSNSDRAGWAAAHRRPSPANRSDNHLDVHIDPPRRSHVGTYVDDRVRRAGGADRCSGGFWVVSPPCRGQCGPVGCLPR